MAPTGPRRRPPRGPTNPRTGASRSGSTRSMHAPPTLFVMALALASAGCHDRNLAPEASHREAPSMPLSDDLERELRAVRADPIDAVGLGDTGYLPYVLRRGEPLIHSDEPAVTARLASAI